MDSIELMFIHLDTSNEVILNLMCTVPTVFYDIGRHAITQYIPHQIMKTDPMILFFV